MALCHNLFSSNRSVRWISIKAQALTCRTLFGIHSRERKGTSKRTKRNKSLTIIQSKTHWNQPKSMFTLMISQSQCQRLIFHTLTLQHHLNAIIFRQSWNMPRTMDLFLSDLKCKTSSGTHSRERKEMRRRTQLMRLSMVSCSLRKSSSQTVQPKM